MNGNDFLTGGDREVHPPPPGPTPTGPYEYLSVSRQPAIAGQLPEMRHIYFFLESFLLSAGYAERIDLINEIRVYRVLIRYLWRFPFDANGPFVRAPTSIYRFQIDDPSISVKAVNEWTPVGL